MKQFSGTLKAKPESISRGITFSDLLATATSPVMRKLAAAAVLGVLAFGGVSYLHKASDKAIGNLGDALSAPYAAAEKIAAEDAQLAKKMVR